MVHCSECKHFIPIRTTGGGGRTISDYTCYHPDNRGDWLSPNGTKAKPYVINANCDCNCFEKKKKED